MNSIRHTIVALALGFAVIGANRPEDRCAIHLIGDSTMADKPTIGNPERGWGQMFPMYFDGEIVFRNHAKNGRSTKSFIDEGLWDGVLKELKPGDYVFIQFGHNDAKKSDSTRFADPQTTYRQNLVRFVRETRKRAAIPVLLTPVHRRKFDDAGAIVDQHGEYPGVVREVAAQEGVPLIDLHAKSKVLFEHAGAEGSKKLFLWIPANRYPALPKGKEDNTHFTALGAFRVAGLVADAVKELHLPLESHLVPVSADALPDAGKIVLLDCFYNCEWKKADTGLVQFHYVWEDTANSGFSELEHEIERLGATVSELHSAPALNDLRTCNVYVIVDPDTHLETAHPNFIGAEAAAVIEEWVKGGGVLLLLANDRGNAEFEHLNGLAERFGIHFNEDSNYRVVGKEYDMGKIANLPPHPVFAGVRQIYVKETSSLRLSAPALPVLTDGGIVTMASAQIGKGLVFAVGDPWLYNEYIGTRKLPAAFENRKAGGNLFRYLLDQAR